MIFSAKGKSYEKSGVRTDTAFQKSLILALSRSLSLLLTLDAGLLVVLSLAQFGKNAGLDALSLKTAQCAVERLVFLHTDLCHLLSLPSGSKETDIS